MDSVHRLFQESARRYPQSVLLHHRGRDWTYEEALDRVRRVAAWLCRGGLEPGDPVALCLPNSIDYVAVYFGCLEAGGVVVGLNPETTVDELAYTLGHCEARFAFVSRAPERHLAGAAKRLERLEKVVRIDFGPPGEALEFGSAEVATMEDVLATEPASELEPSRAEGDLAQLIYTSGTTGCPKGVQLSYRNLASNCRSIVEYLALGPSDSVFVILPFFYSYGNSLLITHAAVGGKLILTPDFVFWNRALDVMEAEEATGFAGVPSSYAMLLHKSNFPRRQFPRLRYITCAGGGLAPPVAKRIREILPRAEIFLMYGQTEATARLSTLLPSELDAKLGSIGRGIPGVRLSVLAPDGRPVEPGETGEIVARGDNVMSGYLKDPKGTAEVLREEGLWTGDLATVDEEGYIFIVGRKSEIIKSGAYRLSPVEIEEVILELDAVAEVAVVGLPDEVLYEVPVACVVPSEGRAVEEAEITEHCRARLPRYKRPRGVRLVESLPRTSSGKIRREVLKERCIQVDSTP